MSGVARDLVLGSDTAAVARRPGSLQLTDAALLLVRRASFAQLARAWLSALPLASVALLFYYFERVEGLSVPRWPFALGVVLAFWFRHQALAQISREFVLVLRPGLPLVAAARLVDVLCTASIAALGLWLWAWPVIALSRLSPFAVLALAPALALRGAVAPSLLARASCAPERGFRAFTSALEDTRGVRALMCGVEGLSWCAFVALFANLYALGAGLLMLAGSVLGLDVAFLSAFLAPDNSFVPLLLMAAASLTLEPLRAAISALAYAEARGRKDGADLHSAIDALRAPRSARGPAAAVIVLAVCALHTPLRADAPEVQVEQGAAAYTPPQAAHDNAVRARVTQILERAEFHEFESDAGDRWHLRELFERLFGGKASRESVPAGSARFELQLPPWLVVCVALLLLGLVSSYLIAETRKRTAPSVAPQASPSVARVELSPPPAAAAPSALDAAALAAAGRHREALRVLYASSLQALERARLIRFESSRTNGQYLAALPAGGPRQVFASITASFELTWYGAAPAGRAEYERARALLEQLQAQLEPEA